MRANQDQILPGPFDFGTEFAAEILKGTSNGDQVSFLTAQWDVPPDPLTFGATVFLWDGVQAGISGDSQVFQPVLAWNDPETFADTWSVAAWTCCNIGNIVHSAMVQVLPGDTLTGYLYPSADGVHWNIYFNSSTLGGERVHGRPPLLRQ
jgi:hypothetical protein